MYRKIKFFLLFIIVIFCFSPDIYADDQMYGVFSNEGIGFYVVVFTVQEDGYACLMGSIGGAIGKWSYDGASSILTFKFFDFGPEKYSTFKLSFNKKERTYTFLNSDYAKYEECKTLHYIADHPPEEIAQAIKDYPEYIKKHMEELAIKKAREQQKLEKLEKEKPEFDRTRNMIIENPHVILSEGFFDNLSDPAIRALRDVFSDHTVHIPEEACIEVIEEYPDMWLMLAVFARPELTTETIERFYPKALELGLELNYNILVSLINNPNTPRYIIEDIIAMKDMPYGAVRPARQRLKEIEAEESQGQSN